MRQELVEKFMEDVEASGGAEGHAIVYDKAEKPIAGLFYVRGEGVEELLEAIEAVTTRWRREADE
jgi:hypothetical protein